MTSAGQPKQSSETGGGDPFIHALDEVSDSAKTHTGRAVRPLSIWLGRRTFKIHFLHGIDWLVGQ